MKNEELSPEYVTLVDQLQKKCDKAIVESIPKESPYSAFNILLNVHSVSIAMMVRAFEDKNLQKEVWKQIQENIERMVKKA